MINSTHQLIIQTAKLGLKMISSDGMPPGHNGLYKDKETPVRNTGHWLLIFSKAFKVTKNKKYRQAVKKLANYLAEESVSRPLGYSFHHRQSDHKDSCNGLIGQAWTVESLVEASSVLKNNKYKKLATQVFLQHKFNTQTGLWHSLETNGVILPTDATLNHQIWFATAGSMLKNKQVDSKITRFLNKLPSNITVLDNGLIYHPIVTHWKKQVNLSSINMLKSILRRIKYGQSTIPGIDQKTFLRQKHKSIGYHAFNMYALAILKNNFPRHKFWQSTLFKSTLKYCVSSQHKKDLVNNPYGFPYNPVGFELPLVLHTFKSFSKQEVVSKTSWWVNQQLLLNFDARTKKMSRNTPDVNTLTARIYELTRSPNVSIK